MFVNHVHSRNRPL